MQSFEPDPVSNKIYRPGVKPLISGVKSLNTADTTNAITARLIIVNDFTAYGFNQSNTSLGQIHYISGHDLSGDVSGNLFILQTLLQLGSVAVNPPPPPVTTETTRSQPILTTLNNNPVVVQGTLELTTPAPPVPVINVDADLSTFTFPYTLGHMYAINAGSGSLSVGSGRAIQLDVQAVRRRPQRAAGPIQRRLFPVHAGVPDRVHDHRLGTVSGGRRWQQRVRQLHVHRAELGVELAATVAR